MPGPRSERSLPLPLSFETLNGLQISVLDETGNTCFDPRYTDSEVGLSATVLILGFDLGLDPVEFWDFLEGFWGGDYRIDDL